MRRASERERGYIMLALLLTVALIAIAAAVIVPSITFEIKRDREEEMIHRGVQYSRAIATYYKKFGRYPTRLEDLESSNNLRFLRKRYKDPMNCPNSKCQDFKLLHFGEVKLSFTGGIPGGTIPGASPAGGLNSGSQPSSSSLGGNSSFGANSTSAFGASSQTANPAAGSDATSPSQAVVPGQTDSTVKSTESGDLSTQVFGGGPIVGVVSAVKCPPSPHDKCESIREFNHKKKYDEWQFIFDPAMGAGLLMTPNPQPPLQGFGQPGTQNLNGQSGNNNGFGTSPTGQQNPNSGSGGFGAPNPPTPPPTPPQQR